MKIIHQQANRCRFIIFIPLTAEMYSSLRKDKRAKDKCNKQIQLVNHKELHLVETGYKKLRTTIRETNQQQTSADEEEPVTLRESGSQFAVSPQCPPVDLSTCSWFEPLT